MLGIIRIYWFDCDKEGCSESTQDYIPVRSRSRSLIQDAMRQAQADGWTFEPRRQRVFPYFSWCPAHTTKQKVEGQ